DYGAFVSISNTKKQGLLHRSQISNHPIDKVEDVIEVGEKIFCKVISTEDGKIGLSMKLVDQTTGRDKDPENLIASRLDGKRKGKSTDSFTPIELGAVLDTVCKRCGIRGHLASSCYTPSGSDSLGLVYSSSEAAVSDEEVSSSIGSIKKIKCLVGVVKKIQEDRKNLKKHSHKKRQKKNEDS
ncbi:uncharacterized protein DEA37_0005136, partial [Paragonimus westermani]